MQFQREFLIFFLIFAIASSSFGQQFKQLKELHTIKALNQNDYFSLAQTADKKYIDTVLDNILIERVIGTEKHEQVFNYITNQLKANKWQVEIDEFTAKTPKFGSVKFKNIVATLKPEASRYLVLACHYDSKYFENEVFVGAIDSAVPCAMILEIAKTMREAIDQSQRDISLKLLFLDGEEAVENWGPKDSIYGARHLAKQMAMRNLRTTQGEIINDLDRIDLFVLLDLIGAPNPQFYSYFDNTSRWHNVMQTIESNLHLLNLLKKHTTQYFSARQTYARIEDDHLPFLKRGVPIMHMITAPFPREWHTPKDNRDLVDMSTVLNINLILKSFVSAYLHLQGIENEGALPEKEL